MSVSGANQMLANQKITVLYGGTSAEREISLLSGKAVIAALKDLQADVLAIDVNAEFITEQLPAIQAHQSEQVFIVLHGGEGENGTIQAALDLAGLLYTGSNMAASSLAMSKWRTKQVWQAMNLPTPDYVMLQKDSQWLAVSAVLGDKLFIKAVCEGSSLGMGIAQNENSFNQVRDLAFKHDEYVLAEKTIEGSEYTVAILGDRALPVIQLKTNNSFYDFEAKYKSHDTQYLCPCDLNDSEEQEVQALALEAFRAVGAAGWGRVDIMRDEAGCFYLLEVNTVPGMTDHSLVPMAAKAAGMDFNVLVYEILQTAERRVGQ